MNTINTVGDLKKALSVYDDSLPFDVRVNGMRDLVLSLNNDTLIYREITGTKPDTLVLCVVPVDAA